PDATSLRFGPCGALWRAVRAALAPLRGRGCRAGGRRRRLSVRDRRLSSQVLLDRTQARDVLQVLVVALGKRVSTGAVGHEIEVLRARRIGGGLDRAATRVGDRPGRQAVDDVSIVGRRLRYLALGERMAEGSFAEDETVDDGGIRLQLHLFF